MRKTIAILFLVFLVAPREFILILYGENWLYAAELVPPVALFVFLSPLRGLARNFLLSNGAFASVRNIQLLELAQHNDWPVVDTTDRQAALAALAALV